MCLVVSHAGQLQSHVCSNKEKTLIAGELLFWWQKRRSFTVGCHVDSVIGAY